MPFLKIWIFDKALLRPGRIDLDIEFIPTTSVYSQTINLVNYLGNLSSDIKNLSNSKFGCALNKNTFMAYKLKITIKFSLWLLCVWTKIRP